MEVNLNWSLISFLPSYDADHIYSVYMKMPFNELLNEYWGCIFYVLLFH